MLEKTVEFSGLDLTHQMRENKTDYFSGMQGIGYRYTAAIFVFHSVFNDVLNI